MKLRKANITDAKFLFDLKNDKDVRKWSIASQEKIDWDKHLEWLHKHLNEIFIIIYDDLEWAGDIRLDGDEIAIKISKEYRGNGIGNWSIETMKSCRDKLTAKIVDGNVPSMRLFIKNGFKVVDHKVTNGVGYYILKYEK